MARPKKNDENPPANTALIPWEDELASAAVEAASTQVAGGQFFSVRAGMLAFAGNPLPDSQIAAIILASTHAQVYYEGAFDSENPSGPKCFAFSFDGKNLAPHQVAVGAGTAQAEACDKCPHNTWGTGVRSDGSPSRGKACRAKQRLALIPAGSIDVQGRLILDSPEQWQESPIGYLDLPVTSVKGFAGYVLQLSASAKRPPWAVVTRIKVTPDIKNQVAVGFSTLQLVGPEYREVVTARAKEARDLIQFPFQPWTGPTVQAPQRGRLPQPVRGVTPQPAPRNGAKGKY